MAVTIQQLNQKHSVWELYNGPWTQMKLLASSGVMMELSAQQFLLKRPAEPADVYIERLKRFTNQNIVGSGFGSYVAQLFRTEPEIQTPADPWYEEFLEQPGRGRGTFIDFWRAAFMQMLTFGRTWILTDLPPVGAEPPSDRGEELERGLNEPYIVDYDPREVINWSEDEDGNLEWVVIRCQNAKEAFLKKRQIVTTWYYFDKQEFQVYQFISDDHSNLPNMDLATYDQNSTEVPMIDQGRHALADYRMVPLQQVKVPDELWLGNKTYLQAKDHINQENEYVWGLRNSNLEMPIVFSDKDIVAPRIGESYWLQLGQGDKFEWTGTKGVAAEQSQKRLQQIIEEMYRALYLQSQGRTASATAGGQSGYSKELDRIPANDILNLYGDIMRSEMQYCLTNVALARKDTAAEFDVRGFKFETKSAMQTIAVAQSVTDLGIPSDTLEKELDKQVAADVGQDWNPDVKQKIFAEIDAAPTRIEQAQQDKQLQTQSFQKSLQTATAKSTVKTEEAALAA